MGIQRLVQINCGKPQGKPDGLCRKCQLLIEHHGVHFRVLKHDDVYDVYSLSWYAKGESESAPSMSQQSRVLHVSGPAFAKFKEFV
ncbi:MAG TPA: hypothetical protein VK661_05035 [Planctomycetota bacterium]|jgi:hypothetical protein|nr:hypothetical protein [Planctomycetota bacterium]